MDIPVLIEAVEKNGYRASSGSPFALSAEGTTPDEAMNNLQQLIQARLNAGGEIRALHLSVPSNPWLRLAGILPDDPLFDDFEQAIARRRQEIDQDPDIP